MVNSRNPARLSRSRGQKPVKSSSREPVQRREDSRVVRPWRQWHGAAMPKNIAPLEVSSPKRPQWGRYIYLSIVILIFVAVTRAAYEHMFWFKTQGIVSGRHHNVAPVQTVSVKEILVRPAESVESGQPLVSLESPELIQSLVRSEAEIARIQGEFLQGDLNTDNAMEVLRGRIQSLEGRMSILEDRYNRERRQIDALEELVRAGAAQGGHLDTLEIQAGRTLAEYREVQAELASSRQQIANLESSQKRQEDEMILSDRLESLKSLRASIKEQLDNLDLRAPVSGIVSQLSVSKGDVLTPGDPAVVLVDKSELRAYMYFPPAAQRSLEEGAVLQVSVSSGEKMPLRIVNIYPAMGRLPPELQSQQRPNESALIVEAIPADGKEFPAAMRSGTPVESRIPRWGFVAGLEKRFRDHRRDDQAMPESTARASADQMQVE